MTFQLQSNRQRLKQQTNNAQINWEHVQLQLQARDGRPNLISKIVLLLTA